MMKGLTSALLPILFLLLSAGCYPADERSKDGDRLAEANAEEKVSTGNADNTVSKEGDKVKRTHYHTVEIKEMKFNPAELLISKGDTVAWVNKDIVAHDVTEERAKKWTSSVIPSKTSWQMVVAESSDYYCSIHVVMKGKLIVK
jgi:plastocyanin